jgi:putative Holliday junction resolvase
MGALGLENRIMAIDLGDPRTGIAVSDMLGMICGEAWTVEEWNMERLSRIIAAEAAERNVGLLVLGLPKNMDGSEGVRAAHSREFRELLRKQTGIPVVFWDERRSSIEAHQILHENGKKEKKHRKTVDAVAASLILEGYLGSLR